MADSLVERSTKLKTVAMRLMFKEEIHMQLEGFKFNRLLTILAGSHAGSAGRLKASLWRSCSSWMSSTSRAKGGSSPLSPLVAAILSSFKTKFFSRSATLGWPVKDNQELGLLQHSSTNSEAFVSGASMAADSAVKFGQKFWVQRCCKGLQSPSCAFKGCEVFRDQKSSSWLVESFFPHKPLQKNQPVWSPRLPSGRSLKASPEPTLDGIMVFLSKSDMEKNMVCQQVFYRTLGPQFSHTAKLMPWICDPLAIGCWTPLRHKSNFATPVLFNSKKLRRRQLPWFGTGPSQLFIPGTASS